MMQLTVRTNREDINAVGQNITEGVENAGVPDGDVIHALYVDFQPQDQSTGFFMEFWNDIPCFVTVYNDNLTKAQEVFKILS